MRGVFSKRGNGMLVTTIAIDWVAISVGMVLGMGICLIISLLEK